MCIVFFARRIHARTKRNAPRLPRRREMRSRYYSGIEAKSKSAKAALPDLRLNLRANNVGMQYAQVCVWHANS